MKRGPSGRYESVNTSGEPVRAFVPFPLPPEPPLNLMRRSQTLLERATLAIGRLERVKQLQVSVKQERLEPTHRPFVPHREKSAGDAGSAPDCA